LPIDIRLTAVPAAGDGSLASHIAAADGDVDIAVPIQGAGTAGLEPYLPAPVTVSRP